MKVFIYLLFFVFYSFQAFALDTIEIEKLYGNLIPISISNINQEDDKELQTVFLALSDIIGNDFKTTVDMDYKGVHNYLADLNILNLKKYQYEGIVYNININIFYQSKEDKKFIIEIKVYDVKNESILTEKKYAFKEDNIRKTAHIVADVAYYAMTGKVGYFQSKILFSSSDLVKNKHSKKSIYIIDQDGYGEKILLQGGIFNSPIFDAKNNALIYVDMTNGEPSLRAVSIFTKDKINLEKLYSGFKYSEYMSSPSLCNKKNCLLASRLLGEGSSIVKFETMGEDTIASGNINTSASSSPDDEKIVFESNYEGRRNLYITGQSFASIRKMLIGSDGIYAEPAWSYDGEWICFTKLRNGLFHIGIIHPDGTDEQILYSSHMIENPMWMPNSDAIIFSEKKSMSSKSTLTMIDLNGRLVRKINTTIGAVSPFIWIIK